MSRARDIADIISGIEINGTLTSDGLTVENNSGATLNVNTALTGADSKILLHEGSTASPANGASIRYAGAANEFSIGVGSSVDTKRISIARDTGDISFYEDTGTTPKFFWDASAESLGIGTSSPYKSLTVGSTDASAWITSGGSNVHLTVSPNGASGSFIVRTGGTNGDPSTTTERMRIDSSGNVGIGTSSPNTYSGYTTLTLNGTSGSLLDFEVNGTHTGEVYADGTTVFGIQAIGSRALNFKTNNQERMRIDSSGNLLVGKTATSGATDGAELRSTGLLVAVTTDDHAGYFNRKGSDGLLVVFSRQAALVGSISVTASATSYNTSSDYRLKTDAQPMTGASARVQALNPVNFEWIADGTRVDGFLAHEAQEVVPEAVTGTKDAMRDEEYEVTPAVYEDVVIPAVLDEDGNEIEAERTEQQLVTEAVMGTRSVPDYQGIDQSKLVPLLTAALQEALIKIDALETRITALEG